MRKPIFKIDNIINIEEKENGLLFNGENKLEIIYPLHNKSNINNNKNIIDSINKLYYNNPNIEILNLEDPFYNDIYITYTSDVKTDMTLNDRRKEFNSNIKLLV